MVSHKLLSILNCRHAQVYNAELPHGCTINVLKSGARAEHGFALIVLYELLAQSTSNFAGYSYSPLRFSIQHSILVGQIAHKGNVRDLAREHNAPRDRFK